MGSRRSPVSSRRSLGPPVSPFRSPVRSHRSPIWSYRSPVGALSQPGAVPAGPRRYPPPVIGSTPLPGGSLPRFGAIPAALRWVPSTPRFSLFTSPFPPSPLRSPVRPHRAPLWTQPHLMWSLHRSSALSSPAASRVGSPPCFGPSLRRSPADARSAPVNAYLPRCVPGLLGGCQAESHTAARWLRGLSGAIPGSFASRWVRRCKLRRCPVATETP